jgi:hypothetical protein
MYKTILLENNVSHCNTCGKDYTKDTWKKLHYVGVQQALNSKDNVELRNCPCGSTLAVPLNQLK